MTYVIELLTTKGKRYERPMGGLYYSLYYNGLVFDVINGNVRKYKTESEAQSCETYIRQHYPQYRGRLRVVPSK